MPRTMESLMASHKATTLRRDAGREQWDLTIRLGDVFRNEDMPFEQRRDEIVERLRASGWVRRAEPVNDANPEVGGGPLDRLLLDLAEAYDVEEFDELWDEVYDRANADADGIRVWIDTVSQ